MENELSQRTFPFRCGYLLKIANHAGVNSLKPFRPFRARVLRFVDKLIPSSWTPQWFPATARTTDRGTNWTNGCTGTFAANLNWPSQRRCRMQLQDASPKRTLPSSPSQKPSSEAKCIFQRDKPISAGVIGTGIFILNWKFNNEWSQTKTSVGEEPLPSTSAFQDEVDRLTRVTRRAHKR